MQLQRPKIIIFIPFKWDIVPWWLYPRSVPITSYPLRTNHTSFLNVSFPLPSCYINAQVNNHCLDEERSAQHRECCAQMTFAMLCAPLIVISDQVTPPPSVFALRISRKNWRGTLPTYRGQSVAYWRIWWSRYRIVLSPFTFSAESCSQTLPEKRRHATKACLGPAVLLLFGALCGWAL